MSRMLYEGVDVEEAKRELLAVSPALVAALAQFVDQAHPAHPHIQIKRRALGVTFGKDNNNKYFAADIYDLLSDDQIGTECAIDLQLLDQIFQKQGYEQLQLFILAELTAFCEGIDYEKKLSAESKAPEIF